MHVKFFLFIIAKRPTYTAWNVFLEMVDSWFINLQKFYFLFRRCSSPYPLGLVPMTHSLSAHRSLPHWPPTHWMCPSIPWLPNTRTLSYPVYLTVVLCASVVPQGQSSNCRHLPMTPPFPHCSLWQWWGKICLDLDIAYLLLIRRVTSLCLYLCSSYPISTLSL